MNLTSRQLEELEQAHDATGALEADQDGDKEEVSEAALEWRRQLIEEASEAVKRAQGRPLDAEITYEAQSLLFDRETRRFGRVSASVPGYLKLQYLTGGEREWGALDVEGYLRDAGETRTLGDLSLQLGIDEDHVAAALARLGLQPLDDSDEDEDGKASAPVPAPAAADAPRPAASPAPPVEAAPAPARAEKPAKAPKAPKVAKAPPQAASAPQAAPPAERAPAKAKKADGPAAVDTATANAFIKKHYLKHSNKELAASTGLSEHTIRRKLGEWGLKRAK